MSLNIFGFVNHLLPSISKSNAEADMEMSLEAMGTVIDVYTQLAMTYENAKFNHKTSKKVVEDFLGELNKAKPETKLPNGFIATSLALFKNVSANGTKLLSELEDIKSEVIVSQAITASKAVVLRSVSHYYFMSKYALDLVNYLILLEAEQGKVELPRDAKLNKKQIEYIEQNLWIYARLLAVYGSDTDKFMGRLKEIESFQITKDSVDDASVMTASKIDLFDNLPVGFIGSPFMTIGLIWAQWEADRYKDLKDKKKLLELRLLHLRMLQDQGQGDAGMEREIESLQKRVTDADYKLAKILESVND